MAEITGEIDIYYRGVTYQRYLKYCDAHQKQIQIEGNKQKGTVKSVHIFKESEPE